MSELSSLGLWQDEDIRGRLRWYRYVADNVMPAKFRIARHVAVKVSLADASEEVLWKELAAKTPQFLNLWYGIRDGADDLRDSRLAKPNLLDLCRELSQRMLTHCNFCRWDCQVDRRQGTKLGTCKLAGDSRVSTFFHHQGVTLPQQIAEKDQGPRLWKTYLKIFVTLFVVW